MTLLIWGKVQSLHRPQKSQVSADSKRVEFEAAEMVRVV